MSARIRYLALLSENPHGLAEFYRVQFGFEELGRSPDGDISLTDGGYNFTLFKARRELREPHMEIGLHHMGLAVDDVDDIVRRYLAFNPRGTVVDEKGGPHRGEARIFDPECNPISLSQRNFSLPAETAARMPRIAHLALNALDTETIRDFYLQVFGLRELFDAHAASRQKPGYRNKHVGDGFSNVAIQAFYNEEEGYEARFGVAHFGLLVKDSQAAGERARAAGAVVAPRPAVRTQSQARMRDPEGNGCDLSQRGWEVDAGKWVRADAA
jgi:catechol 2,3-dioxygenase-like lactoylglutathione lyase family enzyme